MKCKKDDFISDGQSQFGISNSNHNYGVKTFYIGRLQYIKKYLIFQFLDVFIC